MEGPDFAWLCDPQTNGGLMVAVQSSSAAKVEMVLEQAGVKAYAIGRFHDELEGIRCTRAVPSAP
jgi:selenophosphate synthase